MRSKPSIFFALVLAAITIKVMAQDGRDIEIQELKRKLAEAQNRAAAPHSASAPTPNAGLAETAALDVMAADYAANRVEADAKYRGRRLVVSGVVDRIEKDMSPGTFNVFMKSGDSKIRFKFVCEFNSAYSPLRDKVGYEQRDYKIDLIDNKQIAVQRTDTMKSGYYYYNGYYYYGGRRTVAKQQSGWLPIISAGDLLKVEATCGGKSVSVDFTNCKFPDLKLPKN